MFIVLEGPDGAGTTRQSEFLAKRMEAAGRKVFVTAEPTHGEIGAWIRSELKKGELPPEALQLLFCADRAEHIERVIKPAIERGEDVISDRYSLSTLAYGEASGVDRNWLAQINDHFLKPDLTFLLLPPLSVCMERLSRRSTADMFEKEEFQKKVHASYHSILKDNPGIHMIDSSGEKEATADLIWEIISGTLQK